MRPEQQARDGRKELAKVESMGTVITLFCPSDNVRIEYRNATVIAASPDGVDFKNSDGRKIHSNLPYIILEKE